MTERDPVIEELAGAHRELVARAIGQLDEVVVVLRDVAADLRRAAAVPAS